MPVDTPRLTKRALSLFFRVGCERQLLLHLYTETGRAKRGMPPKQGGRAGIGLVGRHGYEHQDAKVTELTAAFGASLVVVGKPGTSPGRTGAVGLLNLLSGPSPAAYSIVVEAGYDGGTVTALKVLGLDTLRDMQGASIDIGELQPDLVQILPPLGQHLIDHPNLPKAYRFEVMPDGIIVEMGAGVDERVRLRVADVKLSSEPGAHYFAETVFYSMTLAAWLRDNNLASRYAVVAAPAVLPGSLEDSALLEAMATAAAQGKQLTPAEAAIALEGDLEVAPVEAFAPRIRQLTRETLPRVLSMPWAQVDYHVDYRCAGCEFLGDPHIMSQGKPTADPLHCWPEAAQTEHLSRVFGLSRGARLALRAGQVGRTTDLAAVAGASPTPAVFLTHHGLKARRTIFPARAQSLQQQASGVIPNSGGDALMPRWPSLHIYVFLDYDPATSFTITLGCRAFWREPLPYGSPLTADTKKWGQAQGDTEVFLVDKPNLVAERREFIRFLRHLRAILKWVDDRDTKDNQSGRRDVRSTYQIYLWDEAQRRHFIRLVSRHLGAILSDPQLRQLAWIFPPPELLADPDTSTRKTPYTLAYDVVQNTIAVPAPHHYTLLDVVRSLVAPPINPPSVHPLYRDTLSNLIPPERIHEYWYRQPNWQTTQGLLVETTTKKLAAMGMVVSQLEQRLSPVLSSRLSAPPLPHPPKRPPGLAPEGYLWLEYTRLNMAVESLQLDRIRAMPTHEREARFRSALLTRRLGGSQAAAAWAAINQTTGGLPPLAQLMIYEMSPDSRDFNARPGDFNFALSPGNRPGFLDEHPYPLIKGTPITAWGADSIDESGMTSVSIAGVDRAGLTIALLPDGRRSKFAELAQYVPQLDFDQDVMIDPVHRDNLTRKVALTLAGIGNPASAVMLPRVATAIGMPTSTLPGTDPTNPAAEVLWQADQLHGRATGRNVATLRKALEAKLQAAGRILLADQWAAWEHALGKQLSLIWGPPGTGKSYTLRAIVQGAVVDALESKKSLRVLISANTYTAVDNILLSLQRDLRGLVGGAVGSAKPYSVTRIQSDRRPVEHDFAVEFADVENIQLGVGNPSAASIALVARLEAPSGIVIVGAPSQQIHNLAVAGIKKPRPSATQKEWFDVVVVDEASQMDVAHSTLVVSKRAKGASCVFAGDDLQLPPIHQAEPPEELEYEVGSIYNYLRHVRGVPPNALNVSFRSNDTLISFTRLAGYDPSLRPHSPMLRLQLDPVPAQQRAQWGAGLPWHPDYPRILDPDHPAVCLLHDDRQSSQSNAIEAGHVTALAALLRTHLHDGLLNENDQTGKPIVRSQSPLYNGDRFWERGVGIVVPHRAQMSLIAYRLVSAFPGDSAERIRGAVDTVERFQGQQRDVILASFGLGDPDVIAAEEEFLFSLRRFNVLASRARAKLIVLVSRSVVEHLSDDSTVLAESLLLKQYAEQYCLPASPQAPGNAWELRWR